MPPFPKLLVSSVVRGAHQGDSHGGLYLVDLEHDSFDQLLDWNSCDINFDGRGADRGLRGIAVRQDLIYVAASDELFVFNRKFDIVESFTNPYLKHCHEICEHRGSLYLTSTGFNSILRFDLTSREFNLGLQLSQQENNYSARVFNPLMPGGPAASVDLHINNICVNELGIFVSGRHVPALVQITPQSVSIVADIPLGTHNAMPFQNGVLFNNTENDHVVWVTRDQRTSIPVHRYPEKDLLNAGSDTSGLARQAFGRGLCPLSDHLVAGGSSPTTVSLYDLAKGQRRQSINLTMDVRNAAHGMAVWPF